MFDNRESFSVVESADPDTPPGSCEKYKFPRYTLYLCIRGTSFQSIAANSLQDPLKFVPLSEYIIRGLPLLATKRRKDNRKASVESEETSSRCKVKARWLARQSQELLDRIRAVDAAAYRRRIEVETPAQSQARRERDAVAHSRRIERQTPDQAQARR
ncbi:hypothetical protein AVEN_114935-1 [Araneus ventricosus]|uniref:Uncharacterized protein n=1 Tax=Araneus ventricosus TaxID=182803 RepID=A0A4Y2DAD4_ARAVE|nr:hypothetical protein AVEN_114935-1 [Araneus ventricosus]